MKTIFTLLLFLVSSGVIFAQCPSAGQDSMPIYCPHEIFDVADLRSIDADTNGVFIDPAGDTMTNTVISLIFPGQYSYLYHVSDSSCPVDTAKYVIHIINNCSGGLTESVLENNALIKANPANDILLLNDPNYDLLEIYETSGRRILMLSEEQTTIDISHMQSGNYLLVLEKNEIKQFQRFIKY